MSQINVADMKPHVSVADDDTGNDTLIQGYIDAAEGWVVKYLRRDLDAEFPGSWPDPILQAVRMLVAHWYENREAVVVGTIASDAPLGVKMLLALYRDLGA